MAFDHDNAVIRQKYMRILCKHLANLAFKGSGRWGQGHCRDCAEWFNVHKRDLILRSVISHSSLTANQDLFFLSRRLKALHVHAGQSWVGLSQGKSVKTSISWRNYSVTHHSFCCIPLPGHLQVQPQPASMSTSSPPPKKSKNSELEEFDVVFQTIVDDLITKGAKDAEIGDAMIRFREVLEYNVPHGKKNRGVSVVTSYKFLVNGDQQTNKDLLRARVLGWCVELLQAYFLVADDIMDQSVTRRGRPCWYKRDDVGTIAINDSFYLECTIYALLKKYFRDQSYYVDIMDLFHETTTQTVIGQSLDLTTAPSASVDFSKFSMERYSAIVKWKTAFYSFYLPVALAMYMAGVNDAESHTNAKSILLQMGHFFQVQDDYLDCYGDPAVTGKIGTDIEDNKCGWLINKALEQASPQQKKILEENYAQHDPAKVKKVKEIFKELKVEEAYHAYEESSYKELMDSIEKFSLNLPKEMFTAFADKIYKRQK
ncbi:farnesyl pyrophosphate synthase-like [Lineus longissimus]|uniref:farnesyl pyrophosphate synthase-like n=1 Tax=Lineus longissimus TaxID=88925 RepID=UPI002B4EDCF2